MSINKVMITGNLTRDPETRTTAGGTTVLSFGVAVNDRRRNAQSGEWEDVANFVDCVMFGNRAESLSHILTKGMKVAIEGKLRYSSWERDGQRRSKLEVVVDEIEFLSSRGSGQGGRQQGGYQQQAQGGYQQGGSYQQQGQGGYGYQQQPNYQAPSQYPAQASQPQYQAPAQQGYTPQPQPAPQPVSAPAPSTSGAADDVYDEDIPF